MVQNWCCITSACRQEGVVVLHGNPAELGQRCGWGEEGAAKKERRNPHPKKSREKQGNSDIKLQTERNQSDNSSRRENRCRHSRRVGVRAKWSWKYVSSCSNIRQKGSKQLKPRDAEQVIFDCFFLISYQENFSPSYWFFIRSRVLPSFRGLRSSTTDTDVRRKGASPAAVLMACKRSRWSHSLSGPGTQSLMSKCWWTPNKPPGLPLEWLWGLAGAHNSAPATCRGVLQQTPSAGSHRSPMPSGLDFVKKTARHIKRRIWIETSLQAHW